MKITIYSAKGSAGKTPIATNIALDREYAIGTNETFHVFDSFIPDQRLLALDLVESFPDIPDDIDIVFDLAGAISAQSHSITSAVKQSDLVIVPIHNEVKSLHSGIGTLRQIAQVDGFKGECLVVATKLQKRRKDQFARDEWDQSEDFLNISEAVRRAGFEFPILPLKFSSAFDAIFEREKSIAQICASDPLANYSFRDVVQQFQIIYDHIDRVDHAKQK